MNNKSKRKFSWKKSQNASAGTSLSQKKKGLLYDMFLNANRNGRTNITRQKGESILVKPRFESTPCGKRNGYYTQESDSECEILVENLTPIRSTVSRSLIDGSEHVKAVERKSKSCGNIAAEEHKKHGLEDLLSLNETCFKSLDLEGIERNCSSSLEKGSCTNSNINKDIDSYECSELKGDKGKSNKCLLTGESSIKEKLFKVPKSGSYVKHNKEVSNVKDSSIAAEDIGAIQNIDWANDSLVCRVFNTHSNVTEKNDKFIKIFEENRKRHLQEDNQLLNSKRNRSICKTSQNNNLRDSHKGNSLLLSEDLKHSDVTTEITSYTNNLREESKRNTIPPESEFIEKDNQTKELSSRIKDTGKKKVPLGERMLVKLVNNNQKTISSPFLKNDKSKVLNEKNTYDENVSFFGLPLRVKTLILKYKGIDKLYDWQAECLNLPAVKEKRNLIYALPTSGGKTLVAEILILKELLSFNKNALFVLPYVSIVQEKVHSLSPFAISLGFLVEEYAAGRGQYPPKKRRNKQSVYVATIEKAHSLVNSLIETGRLSELGVVIVDELHLLGEGRRGATLECLLIKLLYCGEKIQIAGMSATIGNLQELASFLSAEVYCKNFRPVELKEYVKCEGTVWAVNNKDEEELLSVDRRISTSSLSKMDPDGVSGLVMEVVPEHSCLVFCATKKNCENVAHMLIKSMPESCLDIKKSERAVLCQTLLYEGRGKICPTLKICLPYGVGYHHSGLTVDERKLLEDAYRAGILCCLCCTSTLAAGVNLPAKRVILRAPFVGRDFISLSQYKQMTGRAGRAGFDTSGESILICQKSDIERVEALLRSSMNTVHSSLHDVMSGGMQGLIISAIGLSIAATRRELYNMLCCSLLHIQREELEVNVTKLVDSTLKNLFKMKVLKLKERPSASESLGSNDTGDVSVNVSIRGKQCAKGVKYKRFVIKRDAGLQITRLGKASMKGSIDLSKATALYYDLRRAQTGLVLVTHLHLLYLVTPYDTDEIKLIPSVFYESWCDLKAEDQPTAMAIGITESCMLQIMKHQKPPVDEKILHRFYVTLILYELWNLTPVWDVAAKYSIPRGTVQHLMSNASSFASCVLHFCEELDEFWAFKSLLSNLVERLSHCCSAELLPLMQLPAVKLGRARLLYNAGFKTLKDIVKAEVNALVQSVQHLSRRDARTIKTAAKLLLISQAENLKEEADDILEGVSAENLEEC